MDKVALIFFEFSHIKRLKFAKKKLLKVTNLTRKLKQGKSLELRRKSKFIFVVQL